MPVVSSIKSIGISSERARYHATRLNIRIHRDTPHEALYKLVDVIHTDRSNSTLRSGFSYPGYTLSDKTWLQGLDATEQAGINHWLEDSATRYEIEGARRRLIYDELPDRIQHYNYPQALNSQLAIAIKTLPMRIAPAHQWRSTLLNLLQSGIKQDELRWSGILAYLDQLEEAGRRVSKQALLAAIDFSSIRMELFNEIKQETVGVSNGTRYQHISLAGGEDYREWLLSLPDYAMSYFSPHYTERNILLHIRSKTRYDENGRKLLFLEEVQSDWHQRTIKNHNNRSFVSKPPAPFKTDWVSLALKLMLIHAAKNDYDALSWASGDIQASHYHREIVSVKRLYDQTIPQLLSKLSRHWQVTTEQTAVETELSNLSISRHKDKWQVTDRTEKEKDIIVDTQAEAMAIVRQHSQPAMLNVPMFKLPKQMAAHIMEKGLPLFGEQYALRTPVVNQ